MRRGESVCVQITGVNMASQEDDNKLESKSNVNKDQERNFINVYKKFEYILKNKLEPFTKKIESLIEIWKSLGQCNQQNSDIGYIIQIMDWAKLHTLNIVLTGKWKMFKADFETKLLSEVEKTQNELMKISDVFSKKFQKLADVIKNPWDDPVLANLLHDNNATIGQEEIEFFCIETAYLVSVRLKKLCESQCEDLALNLVTAFMNCYNLSQTQNFSLNATKTHILFCFDIHVALLYRYNRKSEIVALFKKLSLEEGLHLIRRFAKKRVKISKVWRNYPEITFLASQVFVTAAVTKPIEDSGELLKELLEAWIAFSVEHSMVDKVEISVRRIIQAATAAQHIYICCEIIHEKFGLKLRTFTVELYIRALTTDMNNLESQKTENEVEKVDETTKRLANGFYNLADILKDNIQVSRECALTAFSLEPTLERLQKIEDLARLSGFNVLDTGQIWECKLHPPISSTDEVCWICNTCGKWMCKPNLDLRLTTNFALNEALNFETLGISSQLCDDLAVVLNGPRYHLLSWLLRWEDLHRLCEMYLNDMERTKNLVTELKFVDIDYSMFATVKREPVDELAGIERGYESFLYADEKFVDMIENCNPEPPELPQAKSDPNTLKTLRMFRHNINKRNKPQVSQAVLESNNLANSSQNHNWFSDHNLDAGLSFNQPRLPDYPRQQTVNGVFNANASRSVFFNSQNSPNSQLKRTSDGAVDFSSSSTRNKQSREGKSSEGRDFRVNLNKRKPSDNVERSMFDYESFQNFSNNYVSSSNDNFLHNIITYEFARVSSEMKRNKPDFLIPTHNQNPTKTSHQRSNFARPGQSSTLIKEENSGSETLNLVKHDKAIVQQRFVKPVKSASLMQCLERKVPSQSESLNLVTHEKVLSQVFSQGARNDNTSFTRSDKLLPHSISLIRKDATSSVKYEKVPSQSKNLVRSDKIQSINLIQDFKSKEDEIISPSKGFPSFDKIPPPPQSQNEQASSSSTKDNKVHCFSLTKNSDGVQMKNSNASFSSSNNDFVLETRQGEFSTVPRAVNSDTTVKSVTKNDNFFKCASEDASLKRTKGQDQEVVPEKRAKVESETCPKNGNGIPPSVEKELSKNKIIKALLTKSESVQNENSSKNANCCLPTSNNSENARSDSCKKANVINCKTPIVQNTQTTLSANNNNHKNVPLVKSPCCKSQQDSVHARDSIGKADIKEKEECVRSEYGKEINQSRSLLLKTLSEQHIPIIVEKSEKNESKADRGEETVVKIDDCAGAKMLDRETVKSENKTSANGDIFKPKRNNHKELKIILHRLSDEVIKSFIPSYTEPGPQNCNCGYNKKRPIGRPRKVMCCKYRMKNSNCSFDRIDYDKYSLRTLRKHDSDRLKKISSKNPRRDNSDIQKKTGPNKNLKKYNNNNKQKKILAVAKSDDSDKLKKPKKDFSDKDKKIVSTKRGDIDKRKNMNPRVVLERLPLDSNYVRSVLSNVPGLNDYEMMRPTNVNHIVNVVQISGGRSTSSVPVQNTQTSTQITPHIQRIGQPRSDKPEHNSNSEMATSTASTPASTSSAIKPATSQPSTLINILSQQIIRPSQSNCVRNRSSPLINILSQQIIRPASTTMNKTAMNSMQTSEAQTNNPKVISTIEQSSQDEVKSTPTTAKTATNAPSSGQGTILQFICKSTLPKFQQAFGKSVYQNNTETTEPATTSTETVTNTDANKKSQTKNSSVNIQPIQGGVIYTRQMPVGQTINLIPPGRGQVFRIATSNSDQISLVKDTVIHSKMSALLAAALQGKQKTSETQSDGESTNEDSVGTRVTVTRPTLVQNARIVKPVLQIPSNVIRTSPQSNLSSTTLEQLREFDMVYKQIKERSSTNTPSDPNTSESNETSQRISVTYLNQGQKYTQLSPVVVVSSYCNLQPAASPALSVTSQGSSSPCVTPAPTPSVPKVSSKSSKGKTVKNTTTQASKASPIPKPQQKPQEDEHTTQRIFDILAEYAEQLRNSPDLNNKPAPRRRSNPPTNPNQNSKRKKNSSSKKSGQCSSMVSEVDIEDHRTAGSEDSSCGVVQISVQEEEQPHIQSVTTESNDSTSGSRQQLILTDASNNQTRNLIIADSSVGEALKMPNTAVLVPGNYIMPVSMVKGGQQIAVVSGGSKILATVPARSGPNMLLFQSFLNQNRNKSGVPTVKYSTIQPISGISSQSLAGVSGQPPVILPPNSHNLTAVTLGQPLTLKKIDESERVNTELLLTISQPRDNGTASTEPPTTTHPDSTNTIITSSTGNVDMEETIIHADNSSEKVYHAYQNSMGTAPIATPVIAQTSCVKEDIQDGQSATTTQNSMTLNVAPENNKNEQGKPLERVQSVLVTACTSNGPMLSHTPPRYRKPSESAAKQ
ncbi:serine-rich adhesin for platelets-like isoform X5 [Tenebrio molitor]|uniref:serine-rich adhesin for platelets-like isoform X5 n=1 Tax=Tenebrio molitor TaxID=7067 RepID=UPI00362487E2